MAVQTKRIVEFDGSDVWWEYDWEDGSGGANRRILTLRGHNGCTGATHPNGAQWPTTGTITVISNGRTFSRTLQPGQDVDVNVPGGQQTRLDVTVDARGRVDGIDHSFSHSAP